MAIWNWPWRRTMRVRELLIGLTASPRSERLGTMCKRYRMRISGLDRGVLRARFRIRAPSIEKSILPDASSSRTIYSQVTRRAAERQGNRLSDLDVKACGGPRFFHYNISGFKECRAGMRGDRKILNRTFARLSPVFVVLGMALAGVCGNPCAS